jgi:hypothetical protein
VRDGDRSTNGVQVPNPTVGAVVVAETAARLAAKAHFAEALTRVLLFS